ncbi:MAG: ABC transporter ATP-binding protein [Clostridia bacterium]|nr:ABC transporter ATP-binding protein [Clostridia bacterium]
MLSVFDLNKRYGKTKACDSVSFTLDKGSVTVLLGPNCAGKSNVIKSIIGFLRYSGDIKVAGLNNKSVEAKRLLGYVPEIPALYPNLTVSEHMEFIARAYKLKDYKPFIDELFERFELSDKKKKFGDELSKGMQQKLNICLGLLPRPSVILFDEPMIGLDPHAIKELRSIIAELRSAGATVLVSTHMIESIDTLWDRTIIMKNGKVEANVTKASLEEEGKTLEELFFEITEGENKDEKGPLDAIFGEGEAE